MKIGVIGVIGVKVMTKRKKTRTKPTRYLFSVLRNYFRRLAFWMRKKKIWYKIMEMETTRCMDKNQRNHTWNDGKAQLARCRSHKPHF